MDIKYSNAFSEVFVLLDNFLDEDDFNKIPKEQIDYIKSNANLEYKYDIDSSKDLMEQNVSKEAKAMIISLYKSYFASSEDARKIDYYLMLNDKKNYIEKNQKINSKENYVNETNYDNIEEKSLKFENVEEKSLIVQKENIFQRIIKNIFSFFIRKR